MTATKLAKIANISRQTAQRAIEGLPVSTVVIGKIAEALGINPTEFLDNGGKIMLSKKTVTIVTDDGMPKDVELSVDDSGKMFAAWSEDAQKAFAQYFSEKQQAESNGGQTTC